MKKFLFNFLLIFHLFYHASLFSEPRELVKIGIILPLSGEQSVYGIDAVKVFKQLEEDLLTKYDYRYKLIYEDGRCGMGNHASTAAKKLINIDKANYLVTACSGEILQVGPIAQKSKVVTTCFACGHPDISDIGDYVFRVFLNLRQGVGLISEEILKNKPESIVVITEESSFTEGIKKELARYLTNTLVMYEDFAEAETDFRSLLTKIMINEPDTILSDNENFRQEILIA